jgi:hypothetical protein
MTWEKIKKRRTFFIDISEEGRILERAPMFYEGNAPSMVDISRIDCVAVREYGQDLYALTACVAGVEVSVSYHKTKEKAVEEFKKLSERVKENDRD